MAHVSPVDESESMKNIRPGNDAARLSIPEILKQNGCLSDMQFETVRSIQQSLLTHGSFLLCDGTGVGKGRIMAGVALNYLLSNPNSVVFWFSTSAKLYPTVRRDADAMLEFSNVFTWGDGHEHGTNIIYLTYPSMKASSKLALLRRVACNRKALIILDECHTLRRCSNHALRLLSFLKEYTHVPVLFTSATPASCPSHLVYLQRLFSDQEFFQTESLTRRFGCNAFEIMSLDLCSSGRLLSRQLCDDGVTVETVQVDVCSSDVVLYDKCTEIFTRHACRSAHQLFFRNLLTSFKVKAVISRVKKEVSQGNSVVVCVQSTGAAFSQRRASGKVTADTMCDEYMKRLGFDLEFHKDLIDVCMREFGRDNVSNLTGNTSKQNLHAECERFQRGETCLAILSRSASTGISLHADGRNARKRIQITVELPWTCESFIQQCGRIHRAKEENSPHYILFKTNIPAERRFFTSLQNRLRNVSAIVNADMSHGRQIVKQLSESYMSFSSRCKRLSLIQIAYTCVRDPPREGAVRARRMDAQALRGICDVALRIIGREFDYENEDDRLKLRSFKDTVRACIPCSVTWEGMWSEDMYFRCNETVRHLILTFLCCHKYSRSPLHLLPDSVVSHIVAIFLSNTPRECQGIVASMGRLGWTGAEFLTSSNERILNRMLMLRVEQQRVLEGILVGNMESHSRKTSCTFDQYLCSGIQVATSFHMIERNVIDDRLAIKVHNVETLQNLWSMHKEEAVTYSGHTYGVHREGKTCNLYAIGARSSCRTLTQDEERTLRQSGVVREVPFCEYEREYKNFCRRQLRKIDRKCGTYVFVQTKMCKHYEGSLKTVVKSSSPKWGHPFTGLLMSTPYSDYSRGVMH